MNDYEFSITPLSILCDEHGNVRFVSWVIDMVRGDFHITVGGEHRIPEAVEVSGDTVMQPGSLMELLNQASGGQFFDQLAAAHEDIYQDHLANKNLVDLGLIPVTSDQVNEERDRRISSGFTFEGKEYQTRDSDRENISGVGTLALAAIAAGAQPGDYRWSDPNKDFSWIANDNSTTPMDAFKALSFSQAGMARKDRLIFAARALKDMPEIPRDYKDDKYWP